MQGLLEILLDAENDSPITLFSEEGVQKVLSQVAVIPYKDELYAIMHPEDEDDFADDEAIVFKVVTKDNDSTLIVEHDEDICFDVFDIYLSLLDE